jgi:hypothetical protein
VRGSINQAHDHTNGRTLKLTERANLHITEIFGLVPQQPASLHNARRVEGHFDFMSKIVPNPPHERQIVVFVFGN